MKHSIKPFAIILLLLLALALLGCPEPYEPTVRDLKIYFRNNSSRDTLMNVIVEFDRKENLTLSELGGLTETSLLNLLPDDRITVSPMEEILIDSLNSEYLRDRLTDETWHFFYVNLDTLRALDWEVIRNTHRGVTVYRFSSFEELEAVDFTLEYPK